MKLPNIPIKLPDFPRPVAVSVAVLAVSAAVFAALLPTLGVSRDSAISENTRLKTQIAQTSKDINQAQLDYKFVNENREKFEQLLGGERLIPHTRRDAALKLQELARQSGVNQLTWDFSNPGQLSAAAVASQAKGNAYRVSVESITLKIGAPLDGQIYQFLVDVGHEFPGAAILASIDLQRDPKVTAEMIEQISHGAQLVRGEVRLLWRTAQANEPEKKTP